MPGGRAAAGATAPLEKLFGNWELALAFWSLPAILAAAFWLPQTRQGQHAHRQAFRVVGLWRDPLAWQVTLYMGLQSSLAYIVFGWLPSILIDRGMTAVEAGLVLSGSVMLQLITALLAPWLAARARDQRLAVVLVMATTSPACSASSMRRCRPSGAGRSCSASARAAPSASPWR